MAKYARKTDKVLDPLVTAIENSLKRYISHGLKPSSLVTESELYYIDTVGRRPSNVPEDAEKVPLEQIVAFRVRTYEAETGRDFPANVLRRNGWKKANIYGYELPELKLVPKEEPKEQTLEQRTGISDGLGDTKLSYLKQYLKEIGKPEYEPVSPEDELEYACRIRQGDMGARKELVQHNLRLVIPTAAKYYNKYRDMMELIQWGNMGLFRAVEKFDPTLGYRFSTYATHWIRAFIGSELIKGKKGVRFPQATIEEISKLNKLTKSYLSSYNRPPYGQEVMKELGWAVVTLKRVQAAYSSKTLWLDMHVNDDEDHYELAAEGPSVVHTADVADKSFRLTEKLKECLDDREIMILRSNAAGINLAEIGRRIKRTRERVRQIKAKAEAKLREKLGIEDIPERMWDW